MRPLWRLPLPSARTRARRLRNDEGWEHDRLGKVVMPLLTYFLFYW